MFYMSHLFCILWILRTDLSFLTSTQIPAPTSSSKSEGSYTYAALRELSHTARQPLSTLGHSAMLETPLASPVSRSTRTNIGETCHNESGGWCEFVADAKSEVGDAWMAGV